MDGVWLMWLPMRKLTNDRERLLVLIEKLLTLVVVEAMVAHSANIKLLGVALLERDGFQKRRSCGVHGLCRGGFMEIMREGGVMNFGFFG